MSRRRVPVLVSVIAGVVLIGACGGSVATPTPSAATPTAALQTVAPVTAAPVTAAPVTESPATAPPETAPLETPQATQAPETQAPETQAPETTAPQTAIPSFAVPSFSFTPDLALEALFPKTIDGNKVKVISLHVKDIQAFFESDPKTKAAFQTFLAALGKTLDDVSEAVGQLTLAGTPRTIVAIRVAGADPTALVTALIQLGIAQQTVPADYAEGTATVGGKNVVTITNTKDSTVPINYVYSYQDVVFLVNETNAATAATLLGALP